MTSGRPATPATLCALAHGTREPAGLATVAALLDRVRRLRPGLPVVTGYVDVARPTPAEVLARVPGPLVVVPLLLSRGRHVRVDIPQAVSARARPARHLGPDPRLVTVLVDRLAQVGGPGDAVVLAAAGSRDPAAGRDVAAVADLLAAAVDRPVLPAYLSGAGPRVAATVQAARRRYGRVVVAAYLLAPGEFHRRLGGCGAAAVTAPLGDHPALARLVLDRYDAVRAPAIA